MTTTDAGFSDVEIATEHASDFLKDEGRLPTRSELAAVLRERSSEDEGTYLSRRLVETAASIDAGDEVDVEFAEEGPQGADLPSDLVETGEALLEAMAEFARALDRSAGRSSVLSSIAHFASYHAAELEGKDGGWLGRGFLVDDLRDLLAGRS